MPEPSPEAVLFDLDRTLCESTQDFEAVLASTFDRVGVDPYCTIGEMAAVMPDTPDVDSNVEFFAATFELAAERADGVEAAALPTRELGATYESLVDYSQARFRDGAERALEAARESCPVGLVTNGGRETQTTKLEALGIADAFDVAVFCDPRAGVPPKPDPEPVRRAVDALDVEPADAVLVGDSKASDVAAAHAAGARSAWVPYGEPTDEGDDADHEPHHEFETPAGVVDLLD